MAAPSLYGFVSRKALVLSFWNISDPSFGGARRINALIDALRPNVMLCQPRTEHPYCQTFAYFPDFGRRKYGINWGMFNFMWPGTARLVRRIVEEQQPSVVILTSMWNVYPFLPRTPCPLVLDTHDVNAVAVGERLGAHHPFTQMVSFWENLTLKRITHVFAASEKDRSEFIARYGVTPDRISVVPNGVTIPHAVEPRNSDKKAPLTVFFMGKLDYAPNREALDFLIRVALPEVRRRCRGEFRLVVTGGPIPHYRNLPEWVEMKGVLSTLDLSKAIAQADICVAPIFSGSGTRLKILEYLAHGKPVVSTPKGAEGLSCIPGQHLLLATAKDFAEKIAQLALNPDLRQSLGRQGRALVEAQYDWKRVAYPKWRQVLSQWVDLNQEI